jgi:hypothetical protein
MGAAAAVHVDADRHVIQRARGFDVPLRIVCWRLLILES